MSTQIEINNIIANSGSFTAALQINGTGVSVSGHNHTIGDVSGLQSVLDGKQASGNYASSSHTHTSSNITDFNSSVSGLLPTIANSGTNRVLISTGTTTGVSAQSNLTFNGSLLTSPSGSFTSNLAIGSNNLTPTNTLNIINSTNLYLWSNFR